MKWNKIYCKQNICPKKTNDLPVGSPILPTGKKWTDGSGSFIPWVIPSPSFTPQQTLGPPSRDVLPDHATSVVRLPAQSPVSADDTPLIVPRSEAVLPPCADADLSDVSGPDCEEEYVVHARDPADEVAANTVASEEEMPACDPAKEFVAVEPLVIPPSIKECQDQEEFMANEASIPANSSEGIHYPSFPEYPVVEKDTAITDAFDFEKDLDEVIKYYRNVQGLLYFKKWWYLRNVDVSVKGCLLTGIPIFARKNAIRVVNDAYSYIIPLHNVDYIRTPDGLDFIESEFEGNVIGN